MVLLLFFQRFIQSNLQTVVVEEVLDHQVMDLVKEISNPVVEMISLEDSNPLAILRLMKTAFLVIQKPKIALLLLPATQRQMKIVFLAILKQKTAHLPHVILKKMRTVFPLLVIQKMKIVNH